MLYSLAKMYRINHIVWHVLKLHVNYHHQHETGLALALAALHCHFDCMLTVIVATHARIAVLQQS